MANVLNTLKIFVNNTDVSDAYRPDAGAITITDGLNQPVTAAIALEQSALPFTIKGGELVTVRDKDQIYFDGIIPVENGLSATYSYLDTHLNKYLKMLSVNATDYQTVLDFQNFPLLTFYNLSGDAILKALIEMTPLAGLVDYSGFSSAFVMPEYTVTGRKFSNIEKELGDLNGFYFSLKTTTITHSDSGDVRAFAASFRSAFDQPAPFAVDGNAHKYVLSSLKFQPRDKPLINKIEIVGGNIPSDDIRVDVFEADGNIGMWQLTQTPFYLQSSNLFDSDFTSVLPVNLDPDVIGSVTLVNPGVFHSGPVYQNTLNINASSTTGAFFFNNSFQSLDQRFSAFEDIILLGGASMIFGLMTDRSTNNISNVELGVWFKPDNTIGLVRSGAEVTPVSGAPTWVANTSYFVRIKETSLGTYAEVIGGKLSPTRQWFPIQQAGTPASGTFAWELIGGSGQLLTGDQMFFGVGDEELPPYVVTDADVADTSLVRLHDNLARYLNGLALFTLDYSAGLDTVSRSITAVSQGFPAQITLSANAPWHTGDFVALTGMGGMSSLNMDGYNIFQYSVTQVTTGDLKNWYLDIVDTTGLGPYTAGGSATRFLPKVQLTAKADGTEYNQQLTVNTDSEGLDLLLASGFTGGTDPGSDISDTGSVFYNGILALAGQANLIKIITRDPIGVELRLTRAGSVDLALEDGEAKDLLSVAQKNVILTVGAADEVAELYAAQVVTEGNTAFISFFDDPDSVPDKGDIIHVAYRYGVPLRIRVEDQASINMVAAMSFIPGDSGIREGSPVDVQDKIFSVDSAIRYGKQYLATRSGLFLQGTVNTSTYHTQSSVPKSGQILSFLLPADNIARSEIITQVVATHVPTITELAMFGCEVSFGKVPDQFLIPPEDPNLRRRADAFTYDIKSVDEVVRMADTSITLAKI